MELRATRVSANLNLLPLALLVGTIVLLTFSMRDFASEPSAPHAQSASEDSRPTATEKGTALLVLAEFYEQSDEEEKAARLYAEAALSTDASIRGKALAALRRLDREHWIEHRVRASGSAGSASYDAASTVMKGVSLAVLTFIALFCLWLLVRCARLVWDAAKPLWSREDEAHVEIGKIAIGSGDGSAILLADVFRVINEEMKRQQALAHSIVAPLSVTPSMRSDNVLIDSISAALDLGERGPKLWALVLGAWIRPAFEVGGSAATVADQTHIVIFLRKKGSVVAHWDRTCPASAILSSMKDIAYAALLESHARK
jgi:hypothetical protein